MTPSVRKIRGARTRRQAKKDLRRAIVRGGYRESKLKIRGKKREDPWVWW